MQPIHYTEGVIKCYIAFKAFLDIQKHSEVVQMIQKGQPEKRDCTFGLTNCVVRQKNVHTLFQNFLDIAGFLLRSLKVGVAHPHNEKGYPY